MDNMVDNMGIKRGQVSTMKNVDNVDNFVDKSGLDHHLGVKIIENRDVFARYRGAN